MRHLLYLLAIPIAVATYISTRSPDGKLLFAILSFFLIALAYSILMPVAFRAPGTLHSVAHLFVYLSVTIAVLATTSEVEEMAGVIDFLIPTFVVGTVGHGALVLWLVRKDVPRSDSDPGRRGGGPMRDTTSADAALTRRGVVGACDKTASSHCSRKIIIHSGL